jgi:Flp pilus assembly pilin Flp
MSAKGTSAPNVVLHRKETTVQQLIRNFIADETATTAIEYTLLATFIAVALISGMSYVGTQLNQAFLNIANAL